MPNKCCLPGMLPVFHSVAGSTETPGVMGSINYGQSVSAYTVFVVPKGRVFALEHVSAVVTRGSQPYPDGYMGDYGAVGYKLSNQENFHIIAFNRKEPGGIMYASHSMKIFMPEDAEVIVKVPLVPNQSGGAEVNVSGHYIEV